MRPAEVWRTGRLINPDRIRQNPRPARRRPRARRREIRVAARPAHQTVRVAELRAARRTARRRLRPRHEKDRGGRARPERRSLRGHRRAVRHQRRRPQPQPPRPIKITEDYFEYGALKYFRGNAHLLEIGTYGEKKDPIGPKAYVDPESKVQRRHLVNRCRGLITQLKKEPRRLTCLFGALFFRVPLCRVGFFRAWHFVTSRALC